MPQPSGITLQFQDWVCQRGGAAGEGRTTRKCIEIFISNKKVRKRKEGGKKKQHSVFACTQKSQCTHTSTQAMTRRRDDEGKCWLKGDSSSHLRRSCHALMGSYPIFAAILTLGNSSAGLLNKNWKKPHPTPWKGGKSNDSPSTHTHTHTHTHIFLLFLALLLQLDFVVQVQLPRESFASWPRQQTSTQVSEAAK